MPQTPPAPVLAGTVKPGTSVPLVRNSRTAPIPKVAAMAVKPIAVDKKSLVSIEEHGHPDEPTFKVKSRNGTLLYAGKDKAKLHEWIDQQELTTLQS